MNNRDVAIEFVKCFCAGDVDAPAPLLTPDLKFKGPFCEFGSADAYLDNLKNGLLRPPWEMDGVVGSCSPRLEMDAYAIIHPATSLEQARAPLDPLAACQPTLQMGAYARH